MPLIDDTGTPRDAVLPVPVDATATFRTVRDAAVVALAFDGPVDGKAFSTAALLRAEGYTGILVGVGPVGLDRLAQGFRVGFDLLEVSDRELQQRQHFHLEPFPFYYQPSGLRKPDLKASA